MNRVPSIDIVIPTLNRAHNIHELLVSILGQTVKPHQIIVVDDSTNNETRLLIASLSSRFLEREVKLLHIWGDKRPPKGICKARNLGMKQTTSDIVLFVDDDVVLDIRYIENLLGAYQKHPEAKGVQHERGL